MRLTLGDGSPNPVAGDELAGPGVDLWAQFGVRLESLTAELEETNRRWRRLWDSTHRIQITGPPIPDMVVSAIVSRPDLLGPRRGWWWDVRRLTFTNGTNAFGPNVVLWKNAPVSINVVDNWAVGGNVPLSHFYGKCELLLGPDEHLVYGVWQGQQSTAPGWTITGEAIQIAEDCLPLYLQ